MKEKLFFVDAESDGLYGKFLSVAAVVVDNDENEIDRYYGAVRTKPEEISTEWVSENVYPYLDEAEMFFSDERSLLESFWTFWLKYRENADCVAYVPYPVESRLFSSCVEQNPEERQFLAPFPIYDLATLLEIRGVGFDCDMQTMSGLDLCSHSAINDVYMMIAAWRKLF